MAARSTRRKTTSSGSAPNDPVTQFALDVVEGRFIQGPHVRNACRRHLKDLKDGNKRGVYWDPDAAARAFRFYETHLTLSDGDFEGLPFLLEPPQQFIIGSIFGWKKSNGFRRFRRAYIEMGKGNGKSPLVAGIGLYGMLADGEAGAQIYAAAAEKGQAEILFNDAVSMMQRSRELRRALTPRGKLKVSRLTHLRSRSFFEPISSQIAKTGSGPRPHMALADELHEHPNRGIIEILERGFKFRKQPLLLMITNSGSDRNSVCWEEHTNAVQVAAGTQTPDEDFTFVGDAWDGSDDTFAFVCSLDKDDDPLEDPTCWIKANPLLGVILEESYLAGVVAQAKSIPGRRNGILRLHFCVWTDSDVAWMSREVLESVLADFDPAIEHRGKDVLIAADLSATQDMTALGFITQTGEVDIEREMPDGSVEVVKAPTFDLWAEAFTPKDTLAARALRDKAPYEVWATGDPDDGESGARTKCLNLVPGKVISLRYMAAALANFADVYAIAALVYDRYAWNKLREEMSSIGLVLREVEHPQGGKIRKRPPDDVIKAAKNKGDEEPLGLWFPGSVNEFELMLLEGRCRIRRNPATISALMSVVIHPDPQNNRWFEKEKAVKRIDIAVALTMAAGAATAKWAWVPGAGSIPFYLQEGFDPERALGISVDKELSEEDRAAAAARDADIDRQVRKMLGMD